MNSRIFAREVWVVEFTARYLWRVLRIFCRKHLSRRCRHCVLSEAYAELEEDGICKLCHENLRQDRSKSESSDARSGRDLDDLLRSYQDHSSGKYDALVLVSGGKDSAYLLHRLNQDYPGLRIATLLVDNGFMSPFALSNAARVRKQFDFDHITVKPKTSFVKKVFHYALTHLDKQQGYSIVDLLDGYITFDTAKNMAADMDIPLVICGLSKVQAENLFGLTEFEFPRDEERAPLKEHAGIALEEVFTEDEMAYWWDGSKWPEQQVPRFILPFVAWDPAEEFILEEVKRLGLINKKGSSPLLTNNALIPVIGIAEVARFGYSCFEVEFGRMVREGKSDRNYWLNLFEMLEYTAKTGRLGNKTVVQTLKALGLSKQDIGIVS